jgi:hypothetical protein
MELTLIIALVIAIPVILFPAAFVWYLNIGGIVQAIRQRKAVQEEKKVAAVVEITG